MTRPGLLLSVCLGFAAPAAGNDPAEPSGDRPEEERAEDPSRETRTGQPPPQAFLRPASASWSRAEIVAFTGNHRAAEDPGVVRDIFQEATASARSTGFGGHFGVRGAAFLNRYVGAAFDLSRAATDFEFAVADREAGTVFVLDVLERRSIEVSGSLILQFPTESATPYAVAGYGWRSATVMDEDPFGTGALHFGAGIKLPVPAFPAFAVGFEFRRVRYDEVDPTLRLGEGPSDGVSASVLTLAVFLRLGRRP